MVADRSAADAGEAAGARPGALPGATFPARLASAALAIALVGFVAWIRALPLKLGAIDDFARAFVARALVFRGEIGSAINSPAARAERAAIADGLRAPLLFRGGDGRDHPVLGGFDSYYWLRLARNVLSHGSACDEMRNGRCWDGYARAPTGRPNLFSHSVHVYAIALAHRVITYFRPGYPLSSSSFWVPVVVGALGVLPAFALGRRLGGTAGALGAAVIVGLNPVVLQRSIGSDNDIWNVVLPLCIAWLLIRAIETSSITRAALWAIAAAAVVAIHAATWSGWVLGYDVALAGLISCLAYVLLWRGRGAAPDARSEARRIAFVAVWFVASSSILVWITAGHAAILAFDPIRQFQLLARSFASEAPGAASIWPDVLNGDFAANIAELKPTSLGGIAHYMGGWPFFIAGFAGLAAMWIGDGTPDRFLELLVSVWFLATFALAFEGYRFVMLLAAPFGLALAAIAAPVERAILAWLAPRMSEGLASVSAFTLIALALVWLAHQGYAAARAYLPDIDSAWRDTFEEIRQNSPSDSIVDIWWDFGYWSEFMAERRTSADGGSVRSRILYWTAKALLAPDEREAAGLFRMLNCGSDPAPGEGIDGAFGKLRRYGLDEIAAADTITAISSLDRTDADEYLAQRGLAPSARTDVLVSSHCTPPESFLVLSDNVPAAPSFHTAGSWDLRHAYAVRRGLTQPREDAIRELVAHLGYDRAAALALLNDAADKRGEQLENFLSPKETYFTSGWIPCRASANGSLICRVAETPLDGTERLEAIQLKPGAQGETRLAVTHQGSATLAYETVGTVVVAAADRLETTHDASAQYPGVAVLFDPSGGRVLAGSPELIESTLTQLLFLDGRYNKLFQKEGERVGYGGNRVTSWRIGWPEHR
jgi:Oligosaccharyl transferase STT3 subunit